MTNAQRTAENGHQPQDSVPSATTLLLAGELPTKALPVTTLVHHLRDGSTLLAPWWVLTQTQFVPRPIDEVFELFSNAENLESLTPGFLGFQILSPLPITMRIGARIAYNL